MPSLRDIFSKVCREENRKSIMLRHSDLSLALNVSTLSTAKDQSYSPDCIAIASHGISQNSNDNQSGRGCPNCDHCKQASHFKKTFWKLHGKPPDWKPSQDHEYRGNIAITKTSRSNNQVPFTKDQLELLHHLIEKANAPANSTSTNVRDGSMHCSGNLALHVAQSPSSSWIVDFGASNHIKVITLSLQLFSLAMILKRYASAQQMVLKPKWQGHE